MHGELLLAARVRGGALERLASDDVFEFLVRAVVAHRLHYPPIVFSVLTDNLLTWLEGADLVDALPQIIEELLSDLIHVFFRNSTICRV